MNFKKIEKFIRYNVIPLLFYPFLNRKKVSKEFLQQINPKKILLIKTHHKIGDLLLSTPLITNLKLKYPGAEIDFLAGNYNYTVVQDNPYLNSVFIYYKKGKIIQNLKTLLQLRKRKYDLGIVASGSSFSVTNTLLAHFSKTALLIGFEAPQQNNYKLTNLVYNYSIHLPGPNTNETMFYLQLLSPFNIKIKNKDEIMGLSKRDEEYGMNWFNNNIKNRKDLKIGIHVGGSRQLHRNWEKGSIDSIIGYLLKLKNIKIILFWGPEEKELMLSLFDKYEKQDILKIPEGTFKQYASLQKHLDLFICTDKGPLHSAVSVGCPTIGIYVGTNPQKWAPFNKNLLALNNPDEKEVIIKIKGFLKSRKIKG